MSERPILFSAPMVRALLDGGKTQTRRELRPQPSSVIHKLFIWKDNATTDEELIGMCPYGQPGDRLWVRESFWGCDLPGYGDQPCVVYDDEWVGKNYKPAEARPWGRKFGRIPSIHMPREASRINLEITGVRVERLQDISEADATAEGVEPEIVPVCCGHYSQTDHGIYGTEVHCCGCPEPDEQAIPAYRTLWESLNGAGSWDANPWVWVIEFKTGMSLPKTKGLAT